jgi:hypothetical protein
MGQESTEFGGVQGSRRHRSSKRAPEDLRPLKETPRKERELEEQAKAVVKRVMHR